MRACLLISLRESGLYGVVYMRGHRGCDVGAYPSAGKLD